MQPGTTPTVAWTSFAAYCIAATFIILRKFFGIEFTGDDLAVLKDLMYAGVIHLVGWLAPDAKRKDEWTPELRAAVQKFVAEWPEEKANAPVS